MELFILKQFDQNTYLQYKQFCNVSDTCFRRNFAILPRIKQRLEDCTLLKPTYRRHDGIRRVAKIFVITGELLWSWFGLKTLIELYGDVVVAVKIIMMCIQYDFDIDIFSYLKSIILQKANSSKRCNNLVNLVTNFNNNIQF